MSIGNRFSKPAALSGIKSITLPDEQQFFADKLINIDRADAVLTLNVSGLAAPLTYTAATVAAAIILMADIIQSVATAPTSSGTELSEAQVSASVTLISLAPDPLASSGGIAVTITGTGFSTLVFPYLYLVPPSGPPVAAFQSNLTIVDDSTMTCICDTGLPTGACFVDLYNNTTFLAECTLTVS